MASKLIMPVRLCAVQDTREQTPWTFSDAVDVEVAKLDAGDYSVKGRENRWAVERKSLADYVNSITTGRERFFRELAILRRYEQACVICEGSLQQIEDHDYRSMAHPSSVLGTTWAICSRYVPVYFCGTRDLAQQMAEGMLYRWLRDEATVEAMKAEGQKAANE